MTKQNELLAPLLDTDKCVIYSDLSTLSTILKTVKPKYL